MPTAICTIQVTPMTWQSPAIDRSDLERLLQEFETRLARLTRSAARQAREPRAVDGVLDTIAMAVADVADRIRGRARNVDVQRLRDDTVELGSKAARRLADEVEHRPLVTLAIAAGVGALAFALLTRRD